MDVDTPDASAEPQVVFRRGKKRKMYRQRGETDGEADAGNAAASTEGATEEQQSAGGVLQPAGGNLIDTAVTTTKASEAANSTGQRRRANDENDEETEDGLSVAEVLRLRNARKSKLRGVELRADAGTREDADATEDAVGGDGGENYQALAAVSTEAIVGGVTKRFAPQIGLVGELVNRHMEEYIASELAKRQPGRPFDPTAAAAAAAAAFESSTLHPFETLDGKIAPGTDGRFLRGEGSQQPALRGKLHEVDLGAESRSSNVARTERARRMLGGDADASQSASGEYAEGDDPGPSQSAAASRAKNQRGMDDEMRDRMVEEFLNENTLDLYGMDDEEAARGDQNLPADERVSDQFRREFMLAMSQSRRRRRTQRPVNAHFAKGQKRPGAKKDHEILRGPKLGGSRNERAAMRDILLKQENEKKAAAS